MSSVTRGRAGFLGAAGIAIAGGPVAAATLRRPNSVAPDRTSGDQPERELVTVWRGLISPSGLPSGAGPLGAPGVGNGCALWVG